MFPTNHEQVIPEQPLLLQALASGLWCTNSLIFEPSSQNPKTNPNPPLSLILLNPNSLNPIDLHIIPVFHLHQKCESLSTFISQPCKPGSLDTIKAKLKNPKPQKPEPYMGGCQNYGPFLGTPNIRCRIIIGIQRGTIVLTTTHMDPSTSSAAMASCTARGQCPDAAPRDLPCLGTQEVTR